jgi:hypothetical protein
MIHSRRHLREEADMHRQEVKKYIEIGRYIDIPTSEIKKHKETQRNKDEQTQIRPVMLRKIYTKKG